MRLSRNTLSVLVGIGMGVVCLGLAGALLLAMAGARELGVLPDSLRPTPVVPTPSGDDAPVQGTPAPAAPSPLGPSPTPFQPAAECSGERLNVLLLGIDGREDNYDAAVRTDTIMAAGIDYASASAKLISFPRDLWVALPDLQGYNITEGRINTAYFNGEAYDLPGGGPALAAKTVTVNFGIRIHRTVVVDFQAFIDAVDALGGIDVEVPEAIYDSYFPADYGDGTIVFTMPAGLQHMDGATALRYARTRHQDDDFQRIKRQQLVLLAIRDKAFTPEVLPRLPALIQALYGSVRTDLTIGEIASLLCLGQKMDRAAIRTYAIDGNYVRAWVTEAGAHVIIPDREAIAPVIEEFNR